ncbi:rhodanese-like domain-containing protein [Vibrio nomapromontoriensis]|uniref:rhodanese-like domain-containing protein n=1 Tax=Vibrio nomapromontoriensis TaxID=2910246 RepID=UPI003D0AEEA8
MKRTLSTLLAALCLASVSFNGLATERAQQGWQLIEQGAMLVDVRTPQEFVDGHIDNSVNYPLSEIEKHFSHVDKSTSIVLYCRSGNRSGQAYRYLQSQGFTQLHNAGGLEEMLAQKQD